MAPANRDSLCPRFHHAVELIGRRWAGAILRGLLGGPARFNELRAWIPEISDRMLAERLRELEAAGLVRRSVVTDTPVRVDYELTKKGRALEQALRAIADWAEEWVDQADIAAHESGASAAAPPAPRRPVKRPARSGRAASGRRRR